jgi:hypothetical protein
MKEFLKRLWQGFPSDRITIEVNVHESLHDYTYEEIKKLLSKPPFEKCLEGDDWKY